MFFSGETGTQGKQYLCGSYVRLSQDDGDKEESNSIVNQKNLIRDFMHKHPEFTLVKEYADDGYSGVNFDRPAFQEMMDDVKAGRINCIIVNTWSRFFRSWVSVSLPSTTMWIPGALRPMRSSLFCPSKTCSTIPTARIFPQRYVLSWQSSERMAILSAALPATVT